MIAKNSAVDAACMACLSPTSQKKVIDTYFENGNAVVIFRCLGCGGITKNTYELHLGTYISGPRKALYSGK